MSTLVCSVAFGLGGLIASTFLVCYVLIAAACRARNNPQDAFPFEVSVACIIWVALVLSTGATMDKIGVTTAYIFQWRTLSLIYLIAFATFALVYGLTVLFSRKLARKFPRLAEASWLA